MGMKELSFQIKNCKNCVLCETRKNVVVGRGSIAPKIVFIGEAPGAEEDQQGKPFVGRSGMLLDRAIKENGITDFCIINIIKCRPPENRKPTSQEVNACKPWLEQQLSILNPEMIVCLGATALNYFFPEKKISESIGQTLKDDTGKRFIGLYHPSYALRGAINIDDYIKSFGRIKFFLENGSTCSPTEVPSDSIIPVTKCDPDIQPVVTQAYVPLHVHTEHGSIGDVFRTEDELAEDLAKKGFKACACTDHGSLSGLYYFQNALKAKGIKPILGIECYVNEGTRQQSHLVLLVKNEIGYKNLLKIHTLSKENTHKIFNKVYQKISINEVCEHSEGLICSTACTSGVLAKRLRRNDPVEPVIEKLLGAFKEDFYFELQPNRLKLANANQEEYNRQLLKLAKKYNVKCIITTDSHYNSPEDKKYHDIVKAINGRKTIKDIEDGKAGFSDDTFCNLTTEQIDCLLRDHHPEVYPIRSELYKNTLEIVEKCNFELPSDLGDTLVGNEDEARKNILNKMDINGYIKKNNYDPKLVKERIDKELDLIFKRGFAKYFDKVLGMCRDADFRKIPRGPGRGSVGGSLVAYLLGITKVDPLRFNTLWERFLSPTRTPDIDMDFSAAKRGSVIGQLRNQYGAGNISYIITFSEWSDKSIIRDVGRVYGVSLSEISKFTKELSTKTAENLKIEDIILTSETAAEFAKKNPEVIDAALRLKGKIRHSGMHAAGVVICKDLESTIPTEVYDKEDVHNARICSWEKDALEKLGVVKFDVLGLSILDVIDESLKNSNLTWDDLPEDYSDPKVFALLKSSRTAGIFQFGSQLVTDYLRHLDPDKFDDLVATNALCRPGPLNSGMSFDYVERKGGKEWTFDHPKLEPITKDTYGIICYQEQIMQVANQIGNFSMVESEKFMKLIAKSKGRDALKEKESQFLDGALANGFTKEQFEEMFNKILEFGRYSFNLSHSIEYSILGYWTAWLKLYYPLAFYTALINTEKDETQSLVFVKEAIDSGIKIVPPSIMRPSELASFDKSRNIIFLGLNKVKGIGPEEMKKILEAGKNFDKIKKIKKNVFQVLVEIGYLDPIERNRKRLLGSKEPTKNTLWAWSEESNNDSDWTEEEKMFRLRKSLPWPRSYEELPATKNDKYRKKLSALKEESVENKAFLSVGWVYDQKAFNNNGKTSYVLNFEDGSSRVTLNLSNTLAIRHREIVDKIVKGEQIDPLVFCLHPYYMSRGKTETREGKLQVLWIGTLDQDVPENILRGIDINTESLKDSEFIVTNISYGISKAGNSYSSVECIDNLDNVTYGAIMANSNSILPMFGSVIRGTWSETPKGTYWRGR
jgi:DNA polymerase-3 subunit alpha